MQVTIRHDDWPDTVARAAWMLPLLWLVPALISLLSAGLAAWATGAVTEWIEPTMDGLRVVTVLADGAVSRNPPAWIRLLVPAALTLAALSVRRVAPVAAPLALIAIGRAAAAGFVFDVFFSRRGWAVAATLCWVLVIALGVRWSVCGESYWRRLAQAAVILALPLAFFFAVQLAQFGSRRILPLALAPMLAEAGPAILIGAIGRVRGAISIPSPRFSPLISIAAAFALTIVIGAGVHGGGKHVKEAERRRLHDELARIPAAHESRPYQQLFFQRGVSFVRDGFGAYYPERSAKLFDSLRSYGVDTVALIPYGRAAAAGDRIRFDPNPDNRPTYSGLARLAHSKGMRILLKPQLMVFGSFFPGSIDVPDPSARSIWFQSYREFILYWAHIAAAIHADLFCVGTELVRMSRHEAEWREVIRQVRTVYPGPLVYAATQGEEFEGLRFWDALDYIGLNNYYPLPDSLDTSEVVRKVEAVQRRFSKPVIFTETGYASVDGSHRQPWAEPVAPVSLSHQVRCYEALFKAFYNKHWFYGMYWWKISADGRGGPEDRSLTPWRKPAMETLRGWYSTPRQITAD